MPAGEADAIYALELRVSPKPILDVALDVVVREGKLVLACDNWGGIEHCEREFADVQATDAEQRSLTVTQAGPKWTIDAASGTRVAVRYRLAPSNPDAMTDERTHFYPVISDRYLHFIGHVGLLRPLEASGEAGTERSIRLHWRGFREVGWTTACSLGVGVDLAALRSYEDLAHAIFVAGDYEIYRAKQPSNVVLAIRPHAWRFGADDLLATAVPVVTEERRIFGDMSAPLLITATPTTVDEDSIHGTMLVDSVALFLPKAGRGLPAPLLGLILAHEYFHRWNTLVMRPSEEEGPGLAWFTEGFAEFYMRRVAYRAGRISRHDYLRHLNGALAEYAKSPVRGAPNERVRSEFRSSVEMQRLPYLRGQIVASTVDAELRRRSGGTRSLDDLVRDLAAEVRRTKVGITSASVLERIGDVTDPAFAQWMRGIVVDGNVAELPRDVFAPCLTLKAVAKDAPLELEYQPSGQSACASVL